MFHYADATNGQSLLCSLRVKIDLAALLSIAKLFFLTSSTLTEKTFVFHRKKPEPSQGLPGFVKNDLAQKPLVR